MRVRPGMAILAGIVALMSSTAFAAQAEAVPAGTSVTHGAASTIGGFHASRVGPSASTQYNVKLSVDREKYCLSTSGGDIVVNTCSSTSLYQRWEIGEHDGYTLWVNVGHPGDVLTTSGSTSGSAMKLKAVHNGDRTQGFIDDPLHTLIYWEPNNGLVLEAANDSSGSLVYLMKYSDVGDQHWVLSVAN